MEGFKSTKEVPTTDKESTTTGEITVFDNLRAKRREENRIYHILKNVAYRLQK